MPPCLPCVDMAFLFYRPLLEYRQFKSKSVYDLPTKANWDDPSFRRWVAWRYDTFSSFIGRLASGIRKPHPNAAVAIKALAKVVIVELDGEMAMAVLPANRKIVLPDLREITRSEQVRFVAEEKFKDRFPDCEIGAMPPFGNLYGMEVYAAESLAKNDEIAFNAGCHEEIIKLSFRDFERLVQPHLTAFTT